MSKVWSRSAMAVVGAAWSAGAFAHDGHGFEGAHGHASDVWGLIALALVAAAWYLRRK